MLKILFLAATHGDEGFSIPVLKKIEKLLPKEDYGYDWLVANPRALKENKRCIDTDLNRCAPGNPDSPLYEERRAAKIIEEAKQYDLVIDIHGSVGVCGVTTIIPLPTRDNLELAITAGVEKNVIWYAPESDEQGPLVQHVNRPAIEIECGPKDEEYIAKQLFKVIARLLEKNKKGLLDSTPSDKEISLTSFYSVYGFESGAHSEKYKDFMLIRSIDNEEFYPYMANQYPGIKYYKMKKLHLNDLDKEFDFLANDVRVTS